MGKIGEIRVHIIEHRREGVVERGDQKRFLGFKVPVEASVRFLGGLHHVADARAFNAALPEESGRGSHDLLMRLGFHFARLAHEKTPGAGLPI